MNMSFIRITVLSIVSFSLIACESVAPEPTWNNPLDPHATMSSSSEVISTSSDSPLESSSSSSIPRIVPIGNLWDYSNPLDSLPEGFEVAGFQATGKFSSFGSSNTGVSELWPNQDSLMQNSIWSSVCGGPICIRGTLDESFGGYSFYQLDYNLFSEAFSIAPLIHETLCLAYSSTSLIRFSIKPSQSISNATEYSFYGINLSQSNQCNVLEFAIEGLSQDTTGIQMTLLNYLTEIRGFSFINSEELSSFNTTHSFKLYSMGIGAGSCLCP